jgi:hypothetical protein
MWWKESVYYEDDRTPMADRQLRQSEELSESKVHSFIVKIWLEEVGDERKQPTWHGHITHVPGGGRRYLKKLSDITDFIASSLEQLGVRSRMGKLKRWFLRLSG